MHILRFAVLLACLAPLLAQAYPDIRVRQDTATAIPVGPFLDATDRTPETGLDVTAMDCGLIKQSDTHPLSETSLTITASGGSNDMSHISNGKYSLELTATDTDTPGWMDLTCVVSGALIVVHNIEVVTAQVWDSWYGVDKQQVHATEITNDLITGSTLAQSALDDITGDTCTELSQAKPAATPSICTMIQALYMALRNQVTVSSTTKTFSNDAGTVIFKKSLSDDGTTYTETEAESGP